MFELIHNVPLLAFLAISFHLALIACFSTSVRSRLVSIFEHPRQPSSGKVFPIFDSLRGVAVLMVVTFHLFQWFNPGFASLGKISLIRNGWCGVELFVVLSGYLIYGAVKTSGRGQAALVKYFKRRFYRIYPVYLVTTIIGFLLVTYAPPPFAWHQAMVRAISGPLEMLKELSYDIFLLRGVNWSLVEFLNPPSWSLGVEVTFYLAVPIYAFVTKKNPLLFALVTFLSLFALKHNGSREFGMLVFFWVGILIYEVERYSMLSKVPRIVWLIVFASGCSMTIYFVAGEWVGMNGGHLSPRYYRTGPLAFGLLFSVLGVLKLEHLFAWFACYPIRFVGIVSYSLFLTHFLLFSVSGLEFYVGLNGIEAIVLTLFVIIPASLMLSAISFALIERPFLSHRF